MPPQICIANPSDARAFRVAVRNDEFSINFSDSLWLKQFRLVGGRRSTPPLLIPLLAVSDAPQAQCIHKLSARGVDAASLPLH